MNAIFSNADAFKKTIRRRNSLEWIVSALLAPVFVAKIVSAPTLWSQIMYGELVLAVLVISAVVFYRGQMESKGDAGINKEECIQFQRRQIQRQIQLLSTARYWYVAPLFIGMLGLELERVVTNWSADRIPWTNLTCLLALPLLAIGVIWLNEVRGVMDLREKLDALS